MLNVSVAVGIMTLKWIIVTSGGLSIRLIPLYGCNLELFKVWFWFSDYRDKWFWFCTCLWNEKLLSCILSYSHAFEMHLYTVNSEKTGEVLKKKLGKAHSWRIFFKSQKV